MSDDARLDLPSILAAAVVVYTATNLLHEGLGHGGASALLGGHAKVLNAIYFSGDGLSESPTRLRQAAGSLANLAAFLALTPLVRRGVGSPTTRFALWLAWTINFLQPAGYLLFSGLGGLGDWAAVVEGWPLPWAWRLGEAALGAALYFLLAPRLLLPPLEPFLGRGPDRLQRARTLMLLPYLIGGTTYVVAGLLNPESLSLVLVSAAAASFGGTSLLAWIWKSLGQAGSDAPASPLGIPRATGWRVAGAVALAIFVGVFGPGIAFSPLRWPAPR